jgi:probable phosphoglycerate mutase
VDKTTLWLARHGETVWTAEDRFNGWSDIELAERGKTQADKLGNYLSRKPLAAIYCSPLQRCVETAQLAGSSFDLVPETIPAIKELNYGVWDGMARPDIKAEYPDVWKSWVRDPAGEAPPEGESGYEVLTRIVPTIKSLVEKHTNQQFLVVAHKAVNRLFLCDVLGVPARDYRKRIGQSACALNCIEWIAGEPRVVLMNSIAHYIDIQG